MNQPKQSGDPWDWGSENTNNGNDSWNWSLDQQSESQHHPQHQLQHQAQQQNQFIPPYPHQKQTPPVQETYYKSLNGSNRPPLVNQHSISSTAPSRTSLSREQTPNHSDAYPPYQNYTFNQQLTPTQRPNSTKSNSSISDHSQWSNDQQTQNASFSHQSIPSYNQTHQTPPPPINNYNWNDQQSVPLQNLQSQAKIPTAGYWQEPSSEKQHQYDSLGNQWTQPPPQQIPQAYSGSNSVAGNEYPEPWPNEQQDQREQRNWPSAESNIPLKQWQNQNTETVHSQQHQNYPPAANLSNWHKSENLDSSQQWQDLGVRNETQPSQWVQQTENSNLPKETQSLDNETSRIPASEWQQIRPPTYFASSNASTTSGSTANISNITEHAEERKKSGMTPATSSTSLNDSTGQSSGMSKAKASFSAQDSLQDQENIDLDWNAGGEEWTSEISSSLSQINLNTNTSKNSEKYQLQSHASIQSNEVIDSAVPDNVPEVGSENARALEPSLNSHDIASADQEGSKGLENSSQVGYDQWYNQSRPVEQDNWYGNESVGNTRTQKYVSKQNVENYENIQQSSDFVNLEVVAPELQERDIYGSRDSINKETLDNDPKATASVSKELGSPREFKQKVSNMDVQKLNQQPPFHAEQVLHLIYSKCLFNNNSFV